ncbi:MAG: hypothetical protein GX630_04140 [Actinobacteria bacterium]|nr:hypothetical protein [Actinomycetota bacterium]
MGVFTERLAVLLLLPWSRSQADSGEARRSRSHGASGERYTGGPVWQLGREHGPSSAVQRADLEAIRAISRVR